MLFPFEITDGVTYNLKFVALIVGTLYGGLRWGAALAVVAAAVQAVQTGVEWGLLLIAISLVLAGAVRLGSGRFFQSAYVGKALLGIGFSAISLALVAILLVIYAIRLPIGPVALFFVCQTVLLLLVLSLSEHIRETLEVRKERVRMEKLTANSGLAVIIAHELRNPLTTVHGFLQLIKRHNPSEQIQYYLNTAMSELTEAEKVIHTYLTITTLNQSEKTDVFLLPSVESAVREVWPAIEQKKIDFHNEVPSSVRLVCNGEQLELCMTHLLRNGANALHRGGKLTIAACQKGKELVIVVSDNGIGMTEEQLEELGMPKYNTRSTGTGTGLMYCYHFVHSLRGRLRIQSQPGRGTTVTITVPLASAG
ncbi:HAMP domain-containing histidine kinase [Paenibacillus sp. TRM 82003]|nr:HAMP domain-containing histidine kinase [Paenibacillus sp. TRM 82003]